MPPALAKCVSSPVAREQQLCKGFTPCLHSCSKVLGGFETTLVYRRVRLEVKGQLGSPWVKTKVPTRLLS